MIWKIYKYTSKTTGLSKIGRTSQSLKDRAGRNGNEYKGCHKFYNAIKKYGWDDFECIVLAETDNEDSAMIIETMFKKWFNTVNNGYDIVLEEGKSPMQGRTHTKEARQKMSEKNKGKKRSDEFKRAVAISSTGRKHTEESKIKIGEKHKGKVVSEETKMKMSKSAIGKHDGEKNPMFGTTWNENQKLASKKPKSEETRKKMSEAKIGKSPWNKGKSTKFKGKSWKLIDGKRVWIDNNIADEKQIK